jgi:16S rRNA (guanine527-N7)-methyltransferase
MLDGQAFGAEDFKAKTDAGAPQMADLETYRGLLADWNGRMNLVGPSAMEAFWLRHAWDSAQLRALAPDAKVWADVGAGAGFPGIVLAILLKSIPGAEVHLVESMAKRCRFLREVVQRLGLPATVHNARAEETRLPGIEVVTARACAPTARLLQFTEPFFKRGAIGLFLKGKEVDAELIEAKKMWRFRAELSPSLSDPSGRILKVEALSRVV